MSQVEQVVRLVRANSPDQSARLAVIDAPELVATATLLSDNVVAWCDDWSANQLLPTELKPSVGSTPRLLDEATLGQADLVWMRIPKSLAGLEEYASLIAESAAPGATVISFGRHQDLNRSMNEVLNQHFGHVYASLGVGKYRALVASQPRVGVTDDSDNALGWPQSRRHNELGLTVWAHGNTFATNRIDNGTRLLVNHLAEVPGGNVLDFGSGSGVISALLGRRSHPATHVSAIDISRWAVDSTKRTALANGVKVETSWGDGITGFPDESLDAIVTNPPFHRGIAKDSDATLALFADAARVLRPGGEIWVVFNSHLPWRTRLNQLVGRAELITQNRNYTLIRSILR